MVPTARRLDVMFKSIQAFLSGYTHFTVNDKKFYLYDKALAYKNSLMDSEGCIDFTAYHYRTGSRCFYSRYWWDFIKYKGHNI